MNFAQANCFDFSMQARVVFFCYSSSLNLATLSLILKARRPIMALQCLGFCECLLMAWVPLPGCHIK